MHRLCLDRMQLLRSAGNAAGGGQASHKAGEFRIEDDNGYIGGELYAPAGHGPWPLVICSHGYTATHANLTDTCIALAQMGAAAVSFDFRNGNGKLSSGDFLRMSVMTEVADLTEVLAYFEHLPGIDPDRIVLLGHSQGGLVSAVVAARERQKVAGLILMYPAFSIVDDVHRLFPDRTKLPETHTMLGATVGKPFAEDVWDLDVYREIAVYDKPVLIMHGTEDAIVPAAYSEKAAQTYASATYIPLKGAGHGFRGADFRQSMEAVAAYLREIHVIGTR